MGHGAFSQIHTLHCSLCLQLKYSFCSAIWNSVNYSENSDALNGPQSFWDIVLSWTRTFKCSNVNDLSIQTQWLIPYGSVLHTDDSLADHALFYSLFLSPLLSWTVNKNIESKSYRFLSFTIHTSLNNYLFISTNKLKSKLLHGPSWNAHQM